ncbi:hypothetical protein pEaSNUABM37_00152 [Erwinia phage pEa_SNUABM_37]|nr:hypothetical protein pEaSNUABM37_00152 [Erwinia phage pEa_SNUABM_37]QXO10622.1 hypothetical protein pEaSNUABM48_00152 [Erwinia phage pEa_SNUABM_48]
MRADVDIGALFDQDRIVDAPIRRRMLLTYICKRRHPDATADELNRTYHITRSAKDVARYLLYLQVMEENLRATFRGVDFGCPLDIIAHVPYWIKYGSVVEMYHDIKAL